MIVEITTLSELLIGAHQLLTRLVQFLHSHQLQKNTLKQQKQKIAYRSQNNDDIY
jgi:hypothetical protein